PPQIVIEQVGYGAGSRHRNITGIPNVLRITIGRLYIEQEPLMWQMEANIDDAEPRVVAHAIERIVSSGASDAWAEPTHGKKGRLGVKLCALVKQETLEQVERVFFEETTTLGVRRYPVQRTVLERHYVSLQTKFGELTVKVGVSKEKIINVSVEYETAKAAAEQFSVPLKRVISEGLFAAADAGIIAGATVDVLENIKHGTPECT
ncbi:MAG: LarC family nickel insertion protein, partial [Planctomycetota bacterium]|nr:LarC family nickel insertion protein [Planctomycetota bacterium]